MLISQLLHAAPFRQQEQPLRWWPRVVWPLGASASGPERQSLSVGVVAACSCWYCNLRPICPLCASPTGTRARWDHAMVLSPVCYLRVCDCEGDLGLSACHVQMDVQVRRVVVVHPAKVHISGTGPQICILLFADASVVGVYACLRTQDPVFQHFSYRPSAVRLET